MSVPESPRAGIAMATFDAPRSDTPTRLAVVGDPHLCVDETVHDKLYKPNTAFRRVIEDVNRRDVDCMLSVGDLTKDGSRDEFNVFDDALAELDAPFVAIPGNHDVPNDFDDHEGLSIESFGERYAPGSFPFTCEVGGVDIVGIDSASASVVSDSHDGIVPSQQIDRIDDALADSEDALVLVHHNLPATVEQFDAYRDAVDPSLSRPPVLREPAQLVDTLSAHDVSLVLSGHLHIPGFAITEGVRELLVPSTCTYPQAYLVLEIDHTGTTAKFVPAATTAESETAYQRRAALKPKAKALAEMAATRLSTFPLYCD